MSENRSSFVVPVAIIACILIIAGAFYYRGQNPQTSNQATSTPTQLSQLLPAASGIDLTKFRPIDNTDKVWGSPNAPVKLVIYTDLECPACKYFHQQLKTLEAKYITSGSLVITYRDFPLDSLHTKSRNEFLAAECVNEIGGSNKFWQFIDKIFEITPSNDGLDPAKLGQTAKALGIETKGFDTCMKARKYADQISKSVNEAVALGAQGTPFWIITSPDGSNTPVFGGLPAEQLSVVFDTLLGKTPETTASSTVQ